MTREDAIHYAYRNDIPITATKEKVYSIDDNLWGRAIECGEMEDPWAVPPQGVWSLTKQTATEPRDVVIGFEQGVPVAARRRGAWPSSSSSTELNEVVGSYGWGRIDMVENRRVGIKSRETYECPARAGADPGPRRPRVDHASSATWPGEGPPGAPLRRARSTTASGSRR